MSETGNIFTNIKNGVISILEKCPMWGYALVFLVLILSHRPDSLILPSFWAEDGVFWYADAYRVGLESLTYPANGYLQSVSRLTACLAVQFPLI